MNKAVIGVFPDSTAALWAIDNLKAHGLGGENVIELMREDMPPAARLPEPGVAPAVELFKGLMIGLIVGGILGAIANQGVGLTLTWPGITFGTPLLDAVVSFAIVGAIAGLLEGLAAAAALGGARRALGLRRRGDAILAVSTDEAHAGEAAELLRADGAWDVRRGARSVPDEFRTVQTVEPEPYGQTAAG